MSCFLKQNIEKKWQRKENAYKQQRNRDVEKWERNRMLQSGAVVSTEMEDELDEANEARVHILVRNVVPPFLDGRITFTKQFEPVIPVKDPTSDMAIVARKGCMSVRRYRDQKEQQQLAAKVNQLEGTKLGNILGIQKKNDREKVAEEDQIDYKKSQQFAELMSDKSEAVSEFAQRNTLKGNLI